MKAIILLFLVTLFACGAFAAPNKPGSRIIGGQDAEEGQFPYIVSVNLCMGDQPGPEPEPPTTTAESGSVDDADDGDDPPEPEPGPGNMCQHVCAGAIIDAQWVLTAAHCVLDAPGDDNSFQIIAGVLDLMDNSTTGAQVVNVSSQVVNPNYEGGVNTYDLVLLKLETALDLTSGVSAIDLPEEGYDSDNDVYISGWGATSTHEEDGPNMPSSLQYVKTNIVSSTDCQTALDTVLKDKPHPFNATANICTGPLTGTVSICEGDSGDPVVDSEANVLVGIASWTVNPCGTVGAPSVHNRVSAVISWIQESIA